MQRSSEVESHNRIDWWRGVVMRALAAMLEDELLEWE